VEETLRNVVQHIVLVVEAVGAVIIAAGVLVAFVQWVLRELKVRPGSYEDTRLQLGRYLALGLEFQLGADILGTAVSPTWTEIGKLGAIAGIRTILNYFLAQDLQRAGHPDAPVAAAANGDGQTARVRAAVAGPLGQ
jgi:uncharacterized membrane protein